MFKEFRQEYVGFEGMNDNNDIFLFNDNTGNKLFHDDTEVSDQSKFIMETWYKIIMKKGRKFVFDLLSYCIVLYEI